MTHRPTPWFAPLIFVGLGLLFGGIAGAFLIVNERFAARAERAEGEVVELVLGSGRRPTWRPIVKFRTAGGMETTFTGGVGSRPPAYAKGDRVRVFYDPKNPAEAMIDSFTDRWIFPLAFGFFGVLWGVIGVVAWVRRSR